MSKSALHDFWERGICGNPFELVVWDWGRRSVQSQQHSNAEWEKHSTNIFGLGLLGETRICLRVIDQFLLLLQTCNEPLYSW